MIKIQQNLRELGEYTQEQMLWKAPEKAKEGRRLLDQKRQVQMTGSASRQNVLPVTFTLKV